MLTADLALSWHRGGRTSPRYVDASSAGLQRVAGDLIAVVEGHVGARRGELERELDEYVGTGTDYKILRGIIKLLLDRCVFETEAETQPEELRGLLFTRARALHPLTEEARAELLAEVSAELGRPSTSLLENLYADLPDNQRLVDFQTLTAEELLDRYNLAQAQALLYRCLEMRLKVEPQAAAGYRRLFEAIKAYGLIHTIHGSPASGYEVRLNGPVSLFHRSQKYGVQMAVFLPALLLCTGWQMRAEIALKHGTALFELSDRQTRLRSHYDEPVNYANPALEKLAAQWPAVASEQWTLEKCGEVIDLGESPFVPDYVFRRADGASVYLEALGFWTPRHLAARLQEFATRGFGNFLLVASDELRGSREPPVELPAHVVTFKTALDARVVKLALDRISSEEHILPD